jgi:hypothetical protein
MTAPSAPAPAGRLGNGQLRRQVAEWLAARPGPHTVGEIVKDLGRSAGAVGNALATFADRAEAGRLTGKSARYEANSGGCTQTTITSRTPPDRLRMRHAMAADAQRAAGAMPTARPFTRVECRRVPAPPLAIGVACDVSGSMSSFAGPVASTAWILARATASLPPPGPPPSPTGSRSARSPYPGAVPARVSEFTATGKYEDFTTAIAALDEALGLARPATAPHPSDRVRRPVQGHPARRRAETHHPPRRLGMPGHLDRPHRHREHHDRHPGDHPR